MNALNQQEARASNAVVEGIICIMGHTTRVLFDPGATHSFVSATFASKLEKESAPMKFQFIISTPLGTKLIASRCFNNVKS